jgi:hypothetical protein
MLGLLNLSGRSRILGIRQALHFDKPMVDDQANPLFELLPFASVALDLPLFVSQSIYAGATHNIPTQLAASLYKLAADFVLLTIG